MATKNYYQNLFDKAHNYYGSDRAEILEFVPESTKTTLEFGCGHGGFSTLLKQRLGTESWAVELSEEAAAITSKKIDRVINQDAFDALKDIPNNYFDAIFFLDILEHLIDPYTLLEQCQAKLTANGVIVASIPNIRYYRAFKNYLFKGEWEYMDQGIMDITHLRFFTYNSINKMFHELGFNKVTIHGINATRRLGYKILNAISFNKLWDVRFLHFIVVAKMS